MSKLTKCDNCGKSEKELESPPPHCMEDHIISTYHLQLLQSKEGKITESKELLLIELCKKCYKDKIHSLLIITQILNT